MFCKQLFCGSLSFLTTIKIEWIWPTLLVSVERKLGAMLTYAWVWTQASIVKEMTAECLLASGKIALKLNGFG